MHAYNCTWCHQPSVLSTVNLSRNALLSAYKAQRITKDNCILIQRSTNNQECIQTLTIINQGGSMLGWGGHADVYLHPPHTTRKSMQLQSILSHSQIVIQRVPIPSTCPMHVCRVTEHRCSSYRGKWHSLRVQCTLYERSFLDSCCHDCYYQSRSDGESWVGYRQTPSASIILEQVLVATKYAFSHLAKVEVVNGLWGELMAKKIGNLSFLLNAPVAFS